MKSIAFLLENMTSRIKAVHWKELQGLIAFKICEIFYDSGDSKAKKTLYQDLYRIYHGHTPSERHHISYASLAFEGASPFKGLLETVETPSGSECHIPSSFTREPSRNVIVGKSFTLQLLKQAMLSAPLCVSGLSLWNRAKEILKNCKKAMAFAKEKFNPYGSLKSGLNADDLWNHVLDKMYEYLNQNTANAEVVQVENDDDDDDNDEDDEGGNVAPGVHPPTWYFRGFWTFQLFGPLTIQQCHRREIILQ